jgi:hypothetical protein
MGNSALIIFERTCSIEKKEAGYLRFLNSSSPSISVTYWKPASIRVVASLTLAAVLQVHSSSLRLIRCMYFCVVKFLVTHLYHYEVGVFCVVELFRAEIVSEVV